MSYDQAVPRFCLDRELLGTRDHLVVDEGTFRWAPEVPAATWHLDGSSKDDSDWCLDTALRLGGSSLDTSPPERFVKLMASMTDVSPIPWQRVMPQRAHLGFVKRLVDEVVVAMASAPLDYYRATWVPGNGIFRSLKRCRVDRPTWEGMVASGEGNVPASRSFEPDGSGFAQPVSYDRLKTLTGRLTVRSGPQILTLKRKHRSCLRSVHGHDGSILALDFAALEARVLLYEHGRRCDDVDLYGMIARDLGYERNAIKGAVISELYGSSKYALGQHLGIEGKQLDDFVRKVKTYFSTSDLLARVKAQFIATGKITNRYGRPVTVDEPLDNIFIAYYGQSTGVDVTMLGFRQVVDRLVTEVPRVRPVFLLHDAILLDVHNEDRLSVKAITHVKVPGYVQRFNLRLETVSD